MRSLQFRLSLGLFISLILTFILLWMLVANGSRYLAESYISTRLETDAESLLTAIQFSPNGQMQLDARRLNPAYTRPFSGHYYKILGPNNVLRSRSLWDQELAVTIRPSGSRLRQHVQGPEHKPLLMLVTGFIKSNHPITIAVADDLSSVESDLAHLQNYFMLAAAILLTGLILVQGLVLHAGLRPLDKTRKELQALAQGRLSQLDQNVPREISPLVSEINHLLSVLDKRLSRSRNALGDLAHALKKPITVLRQTTHQPTLADNPPLQRILTEQLDTIQRLLTRILQRARLAGEGPIGSLFRPEKEIPALLDTLRQMYQDKSIEFDCRIPENLRLAVDREDMLELVGNLLDNACKWAASRVCISFIPEQRATTMIIEDDGPGVDKDKLHSLTRRGLRLDETTEGHGLGLAIVQDIVESLGGELDMQHSSELGGLRVQVRIP